MARVVNQGRWSVEPRKCASGTLMYGSAALQIDKRSELGVRPPSTTHD